MCGIWRLYKRGQSSHSIRRSRARIHAPTTKRTWKHSRRDHGAIRQPKRS